MSAAKAHVTQGPQADRAPAGLSFRVEETLCSALPATMPQARAVPHADYPAWPRRRPWEEATSPGADWPTATLTVHLAQLHKCASSV